MKALVEQKLLSSFALRELSLKNRVALAPMTRSRAGEERIANALMAEYYAQRASAGLLITEATVISEQGIGWLNSPGIYNDAQTEGWRLVTTAVHDQDTPIFLQLWHCGRASHSSFHDGALPVAPSAVTLNGDHIHTPDGKKDYEIPHALETTEVRAIVQDYRQAALRAKQAGFDGIEVHGANGYLIDQFLQSRTNLRTDQYGGSTPNRFRFLDEILDAVLDIWPASSVSVRLSPNGVFNDMGSPDFRETFSYVIQQLNRRDLAFLHLMDGLAFGFHKLGEPMTLAEVRPLFNGPLMGNCGYTQETAEQAVSENRADLISFGRPFLANPDLVERFANNWPLAPLPDMKLWYTPGEKGYADFEPYRRG